jgi:hypothetical protein
MLLKASRKIKEKIEAGGVLSYAVLFVTALNYTSRTVFPFLIIILGGAGETYYNAYIDLIWGVLLTAIIIYIIEKTDTTHRKYFNNQIPIFLIAAYFVTVVVIFAVKTIAIFLVAPALDGMGLLEAQMTEFYFWSVLSYASFLWQLYALYVLGDKELISKRQ